LSVSPAANDRDSVRQLRKILKNVEETEVILRRNDRSMILADVKNKKRKERATEMGVSGNSEL
jgi:hypothetical protein